MEQHFIGQVAQKAVLKHKDSFVLVREKDQDKWSLPGGRLNTNETAEEGVLREIKEELNVECAVESLISVDANLNRGGDKAPKFFVFYLVSVLPNQEIVIANEIAETVLVSKKEELEKYPMYENQKKVIERFLN